MLLDQASKWWLQGQVGADGRLPADWPRWLAWHYNPGVAWSLFADWPQAVLWLTLVLVPALVWVWWRHFRPLGWAENLAFGLVLGGALGNLVDRTLAGFGQLGGVRDFIHVDLGFWPLDPWPTFNFADSGICIGFAIVIARSLLVTPPAAAAQAPQGS